MRPCVLGISGKLFLKRKGPFYVVKTSKFYTKNETEFK